MRNEPADDGPTLDRRRVLQALGAGTALAGLGTGTVAADDREYPKELVSGDDVHPVFGFSALEGDVEPPVDPDHEVEAMIRPVEGRELPEFFYEPTGLSVEPGETVRFSLTTPHHTVTAYHPMFGQVQRVPDGVPAFSSPVLGGGAYWLYTFGEEGVYDFHPTRRSATSVGSSPGRRPVRVRNRPRSRTGRTRTARRRSCARPRGPRRRCSTIRRSIPTASSRGVAWAGTRSLPKARSCSSDRAARRLTDSSGYGR